MTVSELIEELKECDQNADVYYFVDNGEEEVETVYQEELEIGIRMVTIG
jgi:hypothetical protein